MWSATLSVGKISGGTSVNIVPDECVIEVDRRVTPGENVDRVVADIREFLAARLSFAFEFDPPWIECAALTDADNATLANAVLACVTASRRATCCGRSSLWHYTPPRPAPPECPHRVWAGIHSTGAYARRIHRHRAAGKSRRSLLSTVHKFRATSVGKRRLSSPSASTRILTNSATEKSDLNLNMV